MAGWRGGLDLEPGRPQIDDVAVTDVWSRLNSDRNAAMVDVRTRAEWMFVGVPELASVGKTLILAEWQSFPDQRVDAEFAARLEKTLREQQVLADAEIFFICRSGARSKAAAQAMAALGFARCRNVADGFEGPIGPDRRRGRIAGWKAAGLPWVQS